LGLKGVFLDHSLTLETAAATADATAGGPGDSVLEVIGHFSSRI